MITVQPEQLVIEQDPRRILALANNFTGLTVTEEGLMEQRASPLDDCATNDEILEIFYNGGAFKAIRSILEKQGIPGINTNGKYRARERTLTAAAQAERAHQTPTPNGQVHEDRERHYNVIYYPADHTVVGQSHYVDVDRGKDVKERCYDLVMLPCGLWSGGNGDRLHIPSTSPEIAAARLAVRRFVIDVATDYGLGPSSTSPN